jgi:hypothetical protein
MSDPVAKTTTAKPEGPATVAQMKQAAHDWMVPFSNGTLDKLHAEKVPLTAFDEMAKQMAIGLYPTAAKQLQAGIKTAFLLDPYRQVAKQTLGEDTEPDFANDPRFTPALDGGMDPATQHPTMMSLSQFKSHLMSDPTTGYGNTPQAMTQAHQLVNALHDGFMQGGGEEG